jgi:hypothetical protein
VPKTRHPRQAPEKSWKMIFDGWMRDRRIRKACLLFAGFVLLTVAAVVVTLCLSAAGVLGGLVATVSKAVAAPSGWLAAGGGVTATGGGIAAYRWRHRRRHRRLERRAARAARRRAHGRPESSRPAIVLRPERR